MSIIDTVKALFTRELTLEERTAIVTAQADATANLFTAAAEGFEQVSIVQDALADEAYEQASNLRIAASNVDAIGDSLAHAAYESEQRAKKIRALIEV